MLPTSHPMWVTNPTPHAFNTFSRCLVSPNALPLRRFSQSFEFVSSRSSSAVHARCTACNRCVENTRFCKHRGLCEQWNCQAAESLRRMLHPSSRAERSCRGKRKVDHDRARGAHWLIVVRSPRTKGLYRGMDESCVG